MVTNEMNSEPTYIFKHGNVYTVVAGHVIAAVKEAEFGHDENVTGDPLAMPPVPEDIQQGGPPCPQCQAPTEPGDHFCGHCGTPVAEHEQEWGEEPAHGQELGGGIPQHGLEDPANATMGTRAGSTITTPNGLKGTIISKIAGLWSDEVTVRFENGRIVKLPVTDGMKVTAAAPVVATDPVADLETRLAGPSDDLEARHDELETLEQDARIAASGAADDATRERLHTLIVQAAAERKEISEAAAHLASVTAFEPPAPFRMQAAEQESLGTATGGSWLDDTVGRMAAEAEATDYNKLLDEGPEALVAELDDEVLADHGAVRSIASNFIHSHTAAASDDVRGRYEQAFINRVEDRRRDELATRTQTTTTHKEAAAQDEDFNLPDDVLFGL